jgi:hypothetical protein
VKFSQQLTQLFHLKNSKFRLFSLKCSDDRWASRNSIHRQSTTPTTGRRCGRSNQLPPSWNFERRVLFFLKKKWRRLLFVSSKTFKMCVPSAASLRRCAFGMRRLTRPVQAEKAARWTGRWKNIQNVVQLFGPAHQNQCV